MKLVCLPYWKIQYLLNYFIITLVSQIYEKSSSLYCHIRNTLPLLFLPDVRIILNPKKHNIMPINEFTKPNSLSHLEIFKWFSKQIKYNQDRVLCLYIDEINITQSLNFQNKDLFLGFTHNNPMKEATNILVFLFSYNKLLYY